MGEKQVKRVENWIHLLIALYAIELKDNFKTNKSDVGILSIFKRSKVNKDKENRGKERKH